MVVIPEPCFKNQEGGSPQLFLAGTVPYITNLNLPGFLLWLICLPPTGGTTLGPGELFLLL